MFSAAHHLIGGIEMNEPSEVPLLQVAGNDYGEQITYGMEAANGPRRILHPRD